MSISNTPDRQYGSGADESFLKPREHLYASLSSADKQIVGQLWKDKQELLLNAVSNNQKLATAIADYSMQFFVNQGKRWMITKFWPP